METIIPQPKIDYKVIIKCYTYNHQKYIEDALKGFVMQKTNFPFCAVIVDDYSTDQTAEIIRKYEKQYPEIIKGIYLLENYHSQRKSKKSLIQPWLDKTIYIAICEGDDYWIDSSKLQKQVDWLDSHPDYTMCCSDAIISSPNGELDWHRYDKDSDITPESMIVGGGFYIQTATIIYRKVIDNYLKEDYIRQCNTRDYSIQIMCSLKGKVRYFCEKTAVYRFQNPGSWSYDDKYGNVEKLIKKWRSVINLLDGFDKYTSGKYSDTIKYRKIDYISKKIINYKYARNLLYEEFKDVLSLLSFKQRIKLFLRANIIFLFNNKNKH